MNDRQNTVVATAIASLFLALVFFCPWRLEPSGEIRWSPVYQPPLSYVRSYDAEYGRQGGTRIEQEDAHIAFDVLALEVLAIGVVGGGLYLLAAPARHDDGARD